jgi:hypothetical protein
MVTGLPSGGLQKAVYREAWTQKFTYVVLLWARSITLSDIADKTCFVIAPIGDEGSPQRKRSDDVLNYIISLAVQEKGYSAIRADKISKPGMITVDIFHYLLNSDLVVADITDHNPNVFYELAIRHAIRKPVIQMALDGQSIPFDIAQSRTIFYKIDLEGAFLCKQKIIAQIEAIEADADAFDNPLSAAVTIEALRKSDNPLAQSVTEVLNTLQELRQEMSYIQELRQEMSYIRKRVAPLSREAIERIIPLVEERMELKRRSIELRQEMDMLKDKIDEASRAETPENSEERLDSIHKIQIEGTTKGELFRANQTRIRSISEEIYNTNFSEDM